jgi:hypothetical protein
MAPKITPLGLVFEPPPRRGGFSLSELAGGSTLQKGQEPPQSGGSIEG